MLNFPEQNAKAQQKFNNRIGNLLKYQEMLLNQLNTKIDIVSHRKKIFNPDLTLVVILHDPTSVI